MNLSASRVRPILQTERLALRPVTREDLDFVHTIFSDPEVMSHYPKCYSREESDAWIEKTLERYRHDGCGHWLAFLADGTAVGLIGLVMQEVDGVRECEVGYLVHRDHWRHGYAREAAAAVRDVAFQWRMQGQVISLIRPANLPSQAVARSIGMTLWKTTRFRGLEHQVFRIRRIEWEALLR